MILTREELCELTSYKRPSAHIKWLVAQKYPFDIGGDGYPKVLASYLQKRLGGMESFGDRITKRVAPNFKAIMG